MAAESSVQAALDKVAVEDAFEPAPVGVNDEPWVAVVDRQLQPLLDEPFQFAAHMHAADPASML